VALHPVAERLAATMQKVFRDKPVALVLHVPDECAFRGSEEDLMEVLGNLLENAFKWCRGRVELGAVCGPAGLEIRVDDDGPGIPPELAQSILERGARADESAPGHGLGLAVVRAICAAYGGSIGIESSAALGGASVRVRLGGD
jgi:two-component system sensor histidine kinase PhoQ